VARRRNGGKVAPTVGRHDARRDAPPLKAWLLLLLLGGCLNPRPEELPSTSPELEGDSADDPSGTTLAPDPLAPSAEAAPAPSDSAGGSPDSDTDQAPASEPAPPPSEPSGLAGVPDAGADAAPGDGQSDDEDDDQDDDAD